MLARRVFIRRVSQVGLERVGATNAKNPLIIKTDIPSLIRELKRFGRPRGLLSSLNARAMNSGVRPAKTMAKRAVADKRNLKQTKVESALKVSFASKENQRVLISARGRMIPLTELKTPAKQFAKGVKVTATKGKRTLISEAFLAKGNTGKPRVFRRQRIGGGPRRVPRTPLDSLTVPSIPHTLTVEDVTEPTLERYNGAYLNAYDKQLTNSIRKANQRIAT